MRILTILFLLFLLSHRIDAADDGAGPSSAGHIAVNSENGNQQSSLPPAAIRSAAIQKQLENIETELSILRATVRDPQIPDSIRGAVIDQQEELLNRRKELEAELRVHLENLENRRSDPNAPSTSRENPAEDQVELPQLRSVIVRGASVERSTTPPCLKVITHTVRRILRDRSHAPRKASRIN